MPVPKKGDVLKWTWDDNDWSIWRLVEEPHRTEHYCWKADARLVQRGHEEVCDQPAYVVFTCETVEESGWEYVETPFQIFVRETLDSVETV